MDAVLLWTGAKLPCSLNLGNENKSSGKICAGNGRNSPANGWRELTLPDVFAAGAGDRFRGVFLREGGPANRTIFLPHSLHLMSRLQLGRSKSQLARAIFAGPVNFEVSLGVRG